MRRIYTFARDRETPQGFTSDQRVSTDAVAAIAIGIGVQGGWKWEELTHEDSEEPRILVVAPDDADFETFRASFRAAVLQRGVKVSSIDSA